MGQLILSGIPGQELSEESSKFLSEARIGGVILFAHNYESPAQLAELTQQLQGTAPAASHRLPLWIAADQEGGRVQRFKKGFTRLPPALMLAERDSPKLAFEVSELTARELKAVGVNLNFTPVADILSEPKSQVIGDRAYGTTAEDVGKMVTAVIRGHLRVGVVPCVKHFPGHGDTSTDSHFALPKVDRSLEGLRERELIPFVKAFRANVPMVMTAHIINRQLDPKFPATLSKATLQGLLRDELGYDGVIISDDLEMKAVSEHFGEAEIPILAIEAGCDLLIYRSEARARKAYDSLQKALASGRLPPERVLDAANRLRDFKEDFLSELEAPEIVELPQLIGTAEHQAIVAKVAPKGAGPGDPSDPTWGGHQF